jgi:neutral trehalase
MMSAIEHLRQMVGLEPIVSPKPRPDLYHYLGQTPAKQAEALAEKTLPGSDPAVVTARRKRADIFTYIVEFLARSTFEVPYRAEMGKGQNLARRPFLTPSGAAEGGTFDFAEGYRWDTFFQNKTLIIAGAYDLAIDQLLNLADVFQDYGRIPNALTTWFLSHAQPPLEALGVFDLLEAGVPPGAWSDKVMRIVEQDLVKEWWDYATGKKNPRQTSALVNQYGPCITRHTSIHYHPLLVGCEDGKDHNWVTATYGEHYLPVQLNAILYGVLGRLAQYYQTFRPDAERESLYKTLRDDLGEACQRLFWLAEGRWRGFRNYSFRPEDEGPIRYGDLGAEIWPLFVGLATPQQAEVTRQNLAHFYAGDYGLATTSKALRAGGSIEAAPQGWIFQWEENCWPPLMLIATEGLLRYSTSETDAFAQDALSYQARWIRWAEAEFARSGGFHEKSPYSADQQIEGGYYGVLQGFGWTIAAYLTFLQRLAQYQRLESL